MTDETTRGDEGTAEELVSHSLNTFGLTPQKDPETGRSFFLWDSMFDRNSDGLPVPQYTVQEASKFFFGKGPDWLRWRYRKANSYPNGYFVLDGVLLEPKRTDKGFRYYTLADIERMAYALVENQAIGGEKFITVLQLVLHQAVLHGVITDIQH